jgi:hypothetical protein
MISRHPHRHGIRVARMALAAGLGIAGLCRSIPARATLGGDVPSIEANREHLAADVHVTKLARGERHELTLPSGIVVHEYVSPSGAVYAIAWSGSRAPNLNELLGAYFRQFKPQGAGAHHAMSLHGQDFEMEAMAHRGAFTGHAWVPSLVPPGIDARTLLHEAVMR